MLGRVPRGFDNDAGDLAIGAARCALCSTSWLMLDGHSRRAQLGDSWPTHSHELSSARDTAAVRDNAFAGPQQPMQEH